MNSARAGLFLPTVALLVAVAACAPTLPQATSVLPVSPSTEAGKCRVAASQNSPLVTEWPAAEKANLEALLREGAVAVSYSGCSMRLLPQCRLRGAYYWRRTTPARDVLEITSEDELYAKLPLGAASLEGELKRAGNLSVETIVSGQLKLDGAGVMDVPMEGDCARATHLMTSLSIGAFSLTTGGSVAGNASVGVALGQAGGGATRSARLLRGAGDPQSCGQGTDQSPAANCASPLQVFLMPLPGRGAEEGPPDTVRVELVSGNPASRWDVYSDDQVICTTPCSRWLHPARPLLMRARDDTWMSPRDRVEIPNLLAHSAERHLLVAAHPTARGKLATGITFTTLTGMATLAGAALLSVGLATDSGAMTTGGAMSAAIGGVGLIGSIWMITDSMPKAEVTPYRAYPAYPIGSF